MIKKAVSYIGIFFLYLLSLMPFWFLYFISDLLYLLVYYAVGYRKRVVRQNLERAFPEKSPDERRTIEHKFYRHFCDLVIETVKTISISPKQLSKRIIATNPELINKALSSNRKIIGVAGHYCNWELLALGITSNINRKFIIIYKPLSNKVFDKFFVRTRSRFKGIPVAMKLVLAIAHRLRAMSPLGVRQDSENADIYLEESLSNLGNLVILPPSLLLCQIYLATAVVIST